MPGQYVYPVSTRNVSDSFTDHVLRGSVNPGTDYTASWGSRVVAVNDGYIAGTVNTFGGSGGRMVYLDLDDGSGVDYLHLSQINVLIGQRVHAGDLIGYSGASGYGSEWYYGAHLHISIRPTRQHHTENYHNYDFDAFMRGQPAYSGGGSTPIITKGWLDMLTDDQQARLLANSDAIVAALQPGGKIAALYDAIFKTTEVAGSTTGGNSMPGGVLRMESIGYDATFTKIIPELEAVQADLAKVKAKLGITS